MRGYAAQIWRFSILIHFLKVPTHYLNMWSTEYLLWLLPHWKLVHTVLFAWKSSHFSSLLWVHWLILWDTNQVCHSSRAWRVSENANTMEESVYVSNETNFQLERRKLPKMTWQFKQNEITICFWLYKTKWWQM